MRRLASLIGLSALALVPAHASATSEPPLSSSSPDDSGDFVLSITYEGGFVPLEWAFVNTPALMITDDGRLVLQGAIPEIYPGPLLPALVQHTISEEGVDAYLELVEEYGLLEHRQYEGNDMVADAASTVVRIRIDGEEYVHSAYALGLDEETDPDRSALQEFVGHALDPATLVGDDALGEEEPFATDFFLVMAYESDPSMEAETEPAPEVVDWPAAASVRLADADVCAEVPYGEVADVLDAATQLTWFEDDGVTYRVAATPQVPGRSC